MRRISTPRSRVVRKRLAGLLGERGAALIEFILVFPLLLLLCMGIIEFGWWIHANNVVDQSARAGARRMAIDGAISTDAATSANQIISGSGLNQGRVTFTAAIPSQGAVSTSNALSPSLSFRCAYGSSTFTTNPPQMSFTTSYEYRSLFPVLSSPLFFGGIESLAGDVSSTVVLPTETQWISGRGPVLSSGPRVCG